MILVSIICPVSGNVSEVQASCEDMVRDAILTLPSLGGIVEFVFVTAGHFWRHLLPGTALNSSNIRYSYVADSCASIATLFNRGVSLSQGKYLCFCLPGVDLGQKLKNLRKLILHAEDNSSRIVVGRSGPHDCRQSRSESFLPSAEELLSGFFGQGLCQCMDVVPLDNCLLQRGLFEDLGGFDCSEVLTRGFWWDFCIRASKATGIHFCDTPSLNSKWNIHRFPIRGRSRMSGDFLARFLMLKNYTGDSGFDSAASALAVMLSAVSDEEREWLGFSSDGQGARKRGWKVTVLGGQWEYVHNQLCFFNFFSRLSGSGEILWRSVLDTAATELDLVGSDLVIFSRVRTLEGRALSDFCKRSKIPSLYMLDDNWLCIGKEWEVYAELFAPGKPLYENFLYCLKQCDSAIVYNRLLHEDLSLHHPRVKLFPPNIDLSLFPERRFSRKSTIRVGYVGSCRDVEMAFDALFELAMENEAVEIFIMSTHLPEQFRKLDPGRLKFHPFVSSYRVYAELAVSSEIDILIAPLGARRFEGSKCPNKFLEISAVGAAGVYSNVEPYRSYVEDGVTGLLVENSLVEWKRALEALCANEEWRRSIARNALSEVRRLFDTPQLVPRFRDMLSMCIHGEEPLEATWDCEAQDPAGACRGHLLAQEMLGQPS